MVGGSSHADLGASDGDVIGEVSHKQHVGGGLQLLQLPNSKRNAKLGYTHRLVYST